MSDTATTPATPATPAPAATAKPTPPTRTAPAPKAAPCRCGCKAATVRPEARYVAGHDARHAAAIGRDPKADIARVFADAPRLAAKAQAIRDTGKRRAAEKAARKAAQATAKAAYDTALAKALKIG